MANFYLIDFQGERQIVSTLEGRKGCQVLTELDELPPEFHEWNSEEGKFTENKIRSADTVAGSNHIKQAHLIKQLEAATILSGVILTHGMLHEESQELNLDLVTLAELVMTKSQKFRSDEVSRRRKKS